MNAERCAISFSVFGREPLYRQGMLQNLLKAREFYPHYDVLVYVDNTVEDFYRRLLTHHGAKVIESNRESDTIFHRFFPMTHQEYDRVLVRDADSRITSREVTAVEEWIKSGKGFHVMRDHPHHVSPIMAGMWGGGGGSLPGLPEAADSFRQNGNYGEDEDFLRRFIWPKIKKDCLIHDAFSSGPEVKGNPALQFPMERVKGEYVGAKISSFGEPLESLPCPDQRVLIVGNGPSAISRRLGDRIDENFGTVVRINNFSTRGFEEFVGTKTDVWYCNTQQDIRDRDPSHFGEILFPPRGTHCKSIWSDLCKLDSPPCRITCVARHCFQLLASSGVGHPSAGVSALAHYLQVVKTVHLLGFDHFKEGRGAPERHHYFADHARTDCCPHNGEAERRLVNDLVRRGRVNWL